MSMPRHPRVFRVRGIWEHLPRMALILVVAALPACDRMQEPSARAEAATATPAPPAEAVPAVLAAQPAPPASAPAATQPARDCGRCHTCEHPTHESPCLHECTRERKAQMAAELAHMKGPRGVILLDMLSQGRDKVVLKDHFGPVPFDHAGHARWAEISGGCTVCHHYTPEGAEHPACRTCHEASYKHEDMRKPGLKGAYHRQCMGCHREWSHETRCTACHLPRVGPDEQLVQADLITKDDVIGTMHPPIPEPDEEVYETDYPIGTGSKVYFHHKRHAESYGFECAECHRGDSCARCHEYGKEHVQRVRTLEEHHRPCETCHQIDDHCGHCHREAGQPEPVPFTHDQTGWPLGERHADLGCRDCHKEMPFRRLDRNCLGCHRNWRPDTFDHGKATGITLNESHKEIDCGICHPDGSYGEPPLCSECHDTDVSYPKQLPGERAGRSK